MEWVYVHEGSRLNPYSTGIWSATFKNKMKVQHIDVLILILLEYGLRQSLFGLPNNMLIVLILILLEYGLRLDQALR